MATFVVDTNVFAAAAGYAKQLSPACQETVIGFVRDLGYNHHLAVDHARKIIAEYRNNVPRLGFIDELLSRMLTLGRVEYCVVDFDVHGDAMLSASCVIKDRADRKFVAVALAHSAHPEICNVSDMDWIEDEAALNACNVRINHICEQEIYEQYAKNTQRKGAYLNNA